MVGDLHFPQTLLVGALGKRGLSSSSQGECLPRDAALPDLYSLGLRYLCRGSRFNTAV